MIEIYQSLRARGVRARVATHGGTFERELSVPYDLIGPGVSPERCRRFVQSLPGIGPPDQSMWSDDELRTYAGAEAAYFREHEVRVAVTGWTLTALLSTRLAGIPLVTEHAGSWVPPMYERGLLPLPSSIELPIPRWLPARIRRRLFNARVPQLDGYTAGFNRVAAELGVDPIPSFPALLLGDLTLVPEVPEVLGIPRRELEEWTPRDHSRYRSGTRLRYAGPIYARLDAPVPARVQRFMTGPGPMVYVAITSSTRDLVRRVVDGLRSLDVRILVAATVHDLADLEGERVMVDGVLPSHEIMPHAHLSITAGGQGSVQTAFASGTPLIGIPLQPEQDLNVALAERQGAARLVSQRDTDTLADVAREMLGNGHYRENAQRLQEVYAGVDGPAAAAAAIIDLAQSSDRSSIPDRRG